MQMLMRMISFLSLQQGDFILKECKMMGFCVREQPPSSIDVKLCSNFVQDRIICRHNVCNEKNNSWIEMADETPNYGQILQIGV